MQLTKNFNLSEFKCKDGTDVPERFYKNVQRLAINLQILRDYLGEPITINSGYRTVDYNKKLEGSAKNSQHLIANAADIVVKSKTPKELHAIVEKLIAEGKLTFGGVGLYNTFIHVDCRSSKARWDYSTN